MVAPAVEHDATSEKNKKNRIWNSHRRIHRCLVESTALVGFTILAAAPIVAGVAAFSSVPAVAANGDGGAATLGFGGTGGAGQSGFAFDDVYRVGGFFRRLFFRGAFSFSFGIKFAYSVILGLAGGIAPIPRARNSIEEHCAQDDRTHHIRQHLEQIADPLT
ncbi:MAG: hypothetical protein J0H62_07390 [Rhizobiales bacterium]|nr:hypothetical protein [Hyphomicrobiales bacterium]